MLRIADQTLSPRLVVFDKDGTLITFDAFWQAWFRHLVAALDESLPLPHDHRLMLDRVLGVEPQTGDWDPLGPLTLASTNEVRTLIAGMLYAGRQCPWADALEAVRLAEVQARQALAEGDLARPIGDVRGLMQRLHRAGHLVAVATCDDRVTTEKALARLEVEPFVAATICADDGVPVKPEPDMALALCHRLGVSPSEAIMVGDSVLDMEMARRAGLMRAIAVTSGAVPRTQLAAYADLVIRSIHDIEVVAGSDGLCA